MRIPYPERIPYTGAFIFAMVILILPESSPPPFNNARFCGGLISLSHLLSLPVPISPYE